MKFLIAIALAAGSPSGASVENIEVASISEAAEGLRAELQTGTLLVSEGDCLAVRIYSQSPFTHVAAIVMRNGQPFVYDAANGVGVRCQTLEHYLRTQSPDELHVFQPSQLMTDDCQTRFIQSLDGQLGRPYAVAHHLSGEHSDGVHCSEYISEALRDCGLIRVKNPARVSPASLVQGITGHQVYTQTGTVHVVATQVETAPPSTWYGRAWYDTKVCTANCMAKLRRSVLCQ